MSMSNKYLLYLDILGFADLVKRLESKQIYKILNTAIMTLNTSESQYRQSKIKYRSICFSDTILLWPEESTVDVFHHLTYLSGLLFTNLLAQGIPVRGTIVYGDFNVMNDDAKDHELFWGEALINAYNIEKKEKWIGIVICPTAIREITKNGYIEKAEREGLWIQRQKDKHLMINPFFYIKNHSQEITEGMSTKNKVMKEAINKEIKAFRYITSKAFYYKKNYSKLTKMNKEIATKYFNTQSFLKKVLGKECYEYALGIGHKKVFIAIDRQYPYLPSYMPKHYYGG